MQTPAAIKFRELEAQFYNERTDAYRDAERRAAIFVPIHRAKPEDIWQALWPKALYVNARQSVGQKWEAALAPEMTEAWKDWGANPDVFKIRHVAPGIKNQCFQTEGAQAEYIQQTSGVSLHRLYKIQSAACALRNRAAIAAYPFDDINLQNAKGFVHHINTLQQEFGPGWGTNSILHFLAEFGEAVRPCTHLMRTMNYLRPGRGLPVDQHLTVKQAAKLNYHVWLLILDLGYSCIRPSKLRLMDILLSDIAKHGLLPRQDVAAMSATI